MEELRKELSLALELLVEGLEEYWDLERFLCSEGVWTTVSVFELKLWRTGSGSGLSRPNIEVDFRVMDDDTKF